MGTTPLNNLPYPEATDQPFVHLDVKALAEAVAERLFITSTTAPPHMAGRRWHNQSDSRTWISDGAAWHEVAVSQGGGPTLTPATLDTGWSNLAGFEVPAVERTGVTVACRGTVQATAAKAIGALVLTLAEGSRPAARRRFTVASGPSAVVVEVLADGRVLLGTAIPSGNTLALDGIRFSTTALP